MYPILLTICILLNVLLFIPWFKSRNRQTQTNDLARDLAVECEKSRRIPELEQALADATASHKATEGELTDAKVELGAVKETLKQELVKHADNLKTLADAKAVMTNEFKILANDVMGLHGDQFKKQNAEQLDIILKPLRDKLTEFRQGLSSAHTDSVRERAALTEQIKQLSAQSATMTSETVNLTRALKGKAQTQGAWGEMVLTTLLERSGLREGEEYETQVSHQTEQGLRLRPDVIVNLPSQPHAKQSIAGSFHLTVPLTPKLSTKK